MKKVVTMAWMATSKIGVVNIFLKEPKMTPYGDYFGEGMVATIGTVGACKFPNHHTFILTDGIAFPSVGKRPQRHVPSESQQKTCPSIP